MKGRTTSSKAFKPYRVPGSATQYVMPTVPRTVRRRTAIIGAAAALVLGLLIGVIAGHPGTRLAPSQCEPSPGPQSMAASNC